MLQHLLRTDLNQASIHYGLALAAGNSPANALRYAVVSWSQLDAFKVHPHTRLITGNNLGLRGVSSSFGEPRSRCSPTRIVSVATPGDTVVSRSAVCSPSLAGTASLGSVRWFFGAKTLRFLS